MNEKVIFTVDYLAVAMPNNLTLGMVVFYMCK